MPGGVCLVTVAILPFGRLLLGASMGVFTVVEDRIAKVPALT
jgi:hypothetical protein